jgi:hypothetical protein
MNVAIGSNNAATTKDKYLASGASWVMTMQNIRMEPSGEVRFDSVSLDPRSLGLSRPMGEISMPSNRRSDIQGSRGALFSAVMLFDARVG